MNGNTATISVLIPAYDAARYLAETLNSVVAQTVPPLEIIVVDDGSTDRTAEIAAGYSPLVRVLRRPHSGLPASRNAALEAARGTFVAHLDADDLWPVDSLAVRLAALQSAPGADGVIGRQVDFLSADADPDTARTVRLAADPRPGHVAGTSLFHSSTFTRCGGFDESFGVSADLEWLTRNADRGLRVVSIADLVMHRRVHGRNISLTQREEADRARFRILRERLVRQRNGGIP
jgi:glycosyltransferase involved in cell wall biosynthesis